MEVAQLRTELDELVKKHDGLEQEYQTYKRTCNDRFAQIEASLAKLSQQERR